MEFGNVQKAILGIRGGELNSVIAEKLDVIETEGFYISEVTKGSGAQKAGLRENDIIIKLDNIKIATYADLTGFISAKRPNDKVKVTFLRNEKEKAVNVILTKNEVAAISSIGIELKNLDKKTLKKFNLDNGVEITAISNKELLHYGVKKGYVITTINNKEVFSVDNVNDIITNRVEGEVLRIEMLNLRGERERYIFR